MVKEQSDTVVNYLWIHKQKTDPDASMPEDGWLFLQYIERGIEQARQNPDTDFRIWIDYNYLSPSEFLALIALQQKLSQDGASNVTFLDLNRIPEYQNLRGVYGPDNPKHMFIRVDLAKMLILQHCFDQKKYDYVIYADFDIPDLKTQQVRDILNREGLVACVASDTVNNPDATHENDEVQTGFMAFARSQEHFVRFLAQKTIDVSVDHDARVDNRYAGTNVYLTWLYHYVRTNMISNCSIIIQPTLGGETAEGTAGLSEDRACDETPKYLLDQIIFDSKVA